MKYYGNLRNCLAKAGVMLVEYYDILRKPMKVLRESYCNTGETP